MQKLTKITATIGPKSSPYETLKEMIACGMNVCRLNFSHDTQEAQGEKFETIRKISEELKRPIAIIADLQGPKCRIGDFATDEKYPLTPGQTFILDNDPTPGDSTRVQLPDVDVLNSLSKGDRVLVNDGKIELEVVESSKCDTESEHRHCQIVTRVVRGTEIWSRRAFNIPDTMLEASVLTDKDRSDLEYALAKDPDYVAISFVQTHKDVIEAREFIKARTKRPIKIIVKIERPQAIENFERIADETDAVMVARGDLGVEIPFWEVPAATRMMLRTCRKKNKPVIIATHMLASMEQAEFPTRAEISDVATAAYLRADSAMTSEETTIGNHPVKVIDAMAKILSAADRDSIENSADWIRHENLPENDWSRSVASIAHLNKAAAIVVFDCSGEHTRAISCRRPDMPIVAVCDNAVTANQLTLSRGVFPIFNKKMFDAKDVAAALKFAKMEQGKTVVVDGESVTLE
ncbi:MAG: pyruvate kinase [Alphaproteobacteria bacterium]|nr:pyruvate kinase [Alphaproteobacteria bacterium]MCL2757900.1 pyruvate kinase [Alphaproteobacteria bacterium]